MSNLHNIQPEAFEFEPESSFGEFETPFGEFEGDMGECEYEAPFGEEEAAELELPGGPKARKCNDRGIPPRDPRQALGRVACTQHGAHGVADPIDVLGRARERAIDMLDNTISELVNARKAVCAGATPAWPLLGDITLCWLKNGLSVNTDDIRAWTAGTFEPIRSIAEVVRRLVRVRNLIGSRSLRYSCGSPDCQQDWWAFVTPFDESGKCLPGTPPMLILLCRSFWIPGLRPDGTRVPAEIHAEFQAQTIIHEASHLTHCTEDRRGRTIGVAECLAQFVAATNGSPLDSDFVRRCIGTEACRSPGGGAEVFQQEMQEMSKPGFARLGSQRKRILATIFRPEKAIRLKGRPARRGGRETEIELEEPFEWPRWPTSRTFNPPPAQIIPTGPFKTFSPCQAIEDDFSKLTLAVDDLKNQLRQSPSDRGRVTNRSNVVRALSRQIVNRLQNLGYSRQGCTRQDMKLFASSVNAMRGGGADGDIGSWPPARSMAAQEPRKAARESLRHLINWIRQAENNFPRI